MTEENGNGKRLTAEQRLQLLAWIAEGLTDSEINQRASEQDPPWTISKGAITHYRKTRQINTQEARAQAEARAVAAGYATAAERITHLTELAEKLKADLAGDRLWLKRKRWIGPARAGQVVNEEEFNEAEIRQYRGLLEDIAKELGERTVRMKIEEEVQVIWDLPVPGWTPPPPPADSSD